MKQQLCELGFRHDDGGLGFWHVFLNERARV
jgi:hypothetical protein